MEQIDIKEQIDNFKSHLQNNPRTIFSAPFGDGKTSFLREFGSATSKDNFILTICPINYVVAPNEDVLEYVKYDILTQMLKDTHLIEDINFDVDAILSAIHENLFSIENMLKVCGLMASMFPMVTPIVELLKKLNNAIEKDTIKNILNDYRNKRTSIDKYQEQFALMRGGLYENDGYTILIREALKSVKQRRILIIEDLDRIDPQHLFRILNVFGAHIDQNANQNKFGFDNIVIVLDYDITRSTFNHMYGPQANYQGYMSKFMSSYPFKYSITKIAYSKVYDFIESRCHIARSDMSNFSLNNIESVSFDQYLNKLSVRDIAHALDEIERQIKAKEIKMRTGVYSADIPILWLIAILKRLGVNVTVNLIYNGLDSLDGETILNTLGCMLLTSSNYGGVFRFRNETYSIIIDSNEGINSCRFFKDNSAFGGIQVDAYRAIMKAITEAFKYVVDVTCEM